MKNESTLKLTITASKLMAFCLFVAGCGFDAALIMFKGAHSPATLITFLPYICGLIAVKQGLDGANGLVEKWRGGKDETQTP